MSSVPATVSFDRADDIAVIRVDNPPVNALSSHVIAGLDHAMTSFEKDPGLKLAVLYCSGHGFIAGADIKEPLTRERSNAAAAVINRIAGSTKPILAAVHGAALGGGLETALACDYRCALAGSRFGLPEVNIGAVPGYGGTQRLPRLVGLETALQMMVSGSTLDARQAVAAGLIDWLVEAELLQHALAMARNLIEKLAPLRKTDRLLVRDRTKAGELCEAALADAARTRHGEEAPALIIECARQSAMLPIEDGLAFERQQSLPRLNAPQCLAMRHLFFAEQRARKDARIQSEGREAAAQIRERWLEQIHSLTAEGVNPDQLNTALHDFGWVGGLFPAGAGGSSGVHGTQSSLNSVYRCLLALQEAGQVILAQHPGLSSADIDAEFCRAEGFPRYLGGPMYFAAHDANFRDFAKAAHLKNTTQELHP